MRFLPGWIVSLGLFAALLTSEAGAADRCGDGRDFDPSKLTSHIYVSPSGTDSDSCGASPSSPCGSIQRGIDRCGASGCGVLVRYGLYSLKEPIRLRDGVLVYGRCVFDGDSDRKYRSVIDAPPDGKPGIVADSIKRVTLLDGLFVKGSDATSRGGASIAMTVSNSGVGLIIAHSILSSGKGANGAPGQTSPGNSGEGGAEPVGYDGGPGGGGGRACPSSSSSLPGRGGDGGPGTWNNSTGCIFECACSNNNDPKGQAGKDSGQVKGGDGGPGGHQGRGCSGAGHETVGDGGQGGPGNPGSCGKVGGTTTADIWGTFPGTDWHPGLGGSGMAGSTGSGGGGGGGGGACVHMDRDSKWHDDNGMPGGGAGGGGCGGPGGQGGQQGGSSFPIVIYSSTLTASDLTLLPGPGGQGGAGAIGGQGGPGGSGRNGALGHNGFPGCPGSGGPGGTGGQGGAGSGGAGGNGGPSVGVAFVSSDPHQLTSVSIYASQPGTRGLGGAGGQNDPKQCQGAKGADGLAGGWDHGGWHRW